MQRGPAPAAVNIRMQRRQIGVPHEQLAIRHADRRGQFVEQRQKPGRAIPAASGHDDLDVRKPGPPGKPFKPKLVGPREREVRRERVRMDVAGETVLAQQFDPVHEVVTRNGAGRGEDGDARVHGWSHRILE